MRIDLFKDKPIDELALDRIREYAKFLPKFGNSFYVAYSGGKDSIVLLDLMIRSGCAYEIHHNHTTVDNPELVYFVREQAKKHKINIHYPRDKNGKRTNMFELIKKNGMPPLRHRRYCCRVLKEGGGEGRIVTTGVRWGESARRSKRMMFESCFKSKDKKYFHPVIDWTTADVWQYIKEYKLDYCKLYDEGYDRLGCILCPMSRKVQRDIDRYPKYAAAYKKAIKVIFKPANGDVSKFQTSDEYWEWWLDRDAPSTKTDEHQQLLKFDN